MRALVQGLKQPLITLGGLLLVLSFLLSLLAHLTVSMTIGFHNIFLSNTPMILNAMIILATKLACDKQFQNWPLSQKLNHCLLGAVFPISSPRPQKYLAKKTSKCQGNKDDHLEEIEEMSEIPTKRPAAELGFLYLLHTANMIGGMVAFTFLQEGEEYTWTLRKIEDATGISLKIFMYYICPAALLLNAIMRSCMSKITLKFEKP